MRHRPTLTILLLGCLVGTTAHASPKPKTLTINKAAFRYVDTGSGDPVVFVHGSLGDYRSWEHQIGPFAAHHRVIAYSRRNHYPNRLSDGTDNQILRDADDLAAIITALRLGRVHLVGTSSGALVALHTALRHPAMVRSVTLGDPTAFSLARGSGDSLLAAFLRTTYAPSHRALGEKQLKRGVRIFVNGLFGGEGSFERLPPSLRKSMMQNAQALALETGSATFPPLRRGELASAPFPALVLSGERSPKLFHLIADTLSQCLPKAERLTLARASHGMEFQAPQEFNTAVLSFITHH